MTTSITYERKNIYCLLVYWKCLKPLINYLLLWIWFSNFYKLTSNMTLDLIRGKRLKFIYHVWVFLDTCPSLFCFSACINQYECSRFYLSLKLWEFFLCFLPLCHCATCTHSLACSFRPPVHLRAPPGGSRCRNTRGRGARGTAGHTGLRRRVCLFHLECAFPTSFKRTKVGKGST